MMLVAMLMQPNFAQEIRWDDEEPRLVLEAISDGQVSDEEFKEISHTRGFIRLGQREIGMGREFSHSEFREYLDSQVPHRYRLRKTLNDWSQIDFSSLANRAKRYLPQGADLATTVYPSIKPKPNSFVWEIDSDPAIFLFLDPAKSSEEVATTITHELHHIGYGKSCPSQKFISWKSNLTDSQQTAWTWLGAYGEGFAVLAAAKDISNPVGDMGDEVQKAWTDGMKNLDRDFSLVQEFLIASASGKLDSQQSMEKARSFYGVQGPWYTVGFHIAITIEKELGREKLIECYTDPRKLLIFYNDAVKKGERKQPTFSAELIRELGLLRSTED
ncbi:MAG: hypothetical protein KDC26_08940 [Armatimonadetes bacterium]|nr:hypothetical protein [Armatimonadota bacterium]